MSLHSPLVDKDELAIDGMSGDVLRGLHPDISQAGLGHDVGVQTADSHQAAQVATFIVGFVVLVQTHFGRRPTLQVTRAVDCAEALAVSCDEREGRDEGWMPNGPASLVRGRPHAEGMMGNCYSSMNWKKTRLPL